MTYLAVAGALQSRVGVLDLDSYYHYRHAERLRSEGVWDGSFPWIPAHVMGREGSDLWYGFHLLLAPATSAADPFGAIERMSVAVTALLLLCIALALRWLQTSAWWAWPAVALFAAPAVLSHLLMMRPHALSLGLAVLAFAAAVRGATRPLLLLAFATAWIHLSLAWLSAFAAAAVLAAKVLRGERPWREAAAIVVGIAAGLALRPNPIGALAIAKVQLVDLTLAKLDAVPLDIGQELLPLSVAELGKRFLPLVILWGASTVAAVVALAAFRSRLPPDAVVAIAAAALLSAAFLAITLVLFRRAYDPWAAFTVLLAAQVVSALARDRARGSRVAAALVPVVLAALLASRSMRPVLAQRERSIAPYRPVAEWIAKDGKPGDLVYHVQWYTFAPLMFWIPDRRFSSGIDPVFSYAYDRDLYWKAYHMRQGDAPGGTCGAPSCANQPVEPLSLVLRRDFQARYLLVESRSHVCNRIAGADAGLERALQQDLMVVYRVLPQEAK